MGQFKNSEEVVDVVGGFFRKVSKLGAEGDPVVGKIQGTIHALDLVIKVDIKNPETNIILDFTKEPFEVLIDDASVTPTAVFTMDADITNRFWQGKVNLPIAMAKRDISAKGPIPKILKLMPAITPLYKMYSKHLTEIGRGDMLFK